MTALPFAVGSGVIRIGELSLACVVTSTGEHLITGRGVETLLRGSASKSRNSARQIDRILSTTLGNKAHPSVAYVPQGGRGPAFGYPASMLVDLSNALVDLALARKLHPKQEPALEGARALLRALANAALADMIDDACGIPRAPGTTEARVNELLDELATERARGVELTQRVDVLEARVANAGVLGERYALTNVEAPLQRAAALRARALGGKPSRHLRGIRNRVERATGHCRKGDTWASFPAEPERVSVLRREVRREVLDAEGLYRTWRRERRDGQLTLDGLEAA